MADGNEKVQVLLRGNSASSNPFTVCIIANPVLEVPQQSGNFIADPITRDKASYDLEVKYILDCLFGKLPGQAETLLGDPSIGPKVKFVSIFDDTLSVEESNALVTEITDLLAPRRSEFKPFLSRYGVSADIVYAVSASPRNSRASAYFSSDDDAQGGDVFHLDNATMYHRYYCRIPGTIAIHKNPDTIVPLHEFSHALSSYENGSIVDLYVDSDPASNCKQGRPIPSLFGIYNGQTLQSDPTRDKIGYERGWRSYHCELVDSNNPAAMDNFYRASGGALSCKHDLVTQLFLRDRLKAKVDNR